MSTGVNLYSCNMGGDQVCVGVICTVGLLSEGIWVIWYCRYRSSDHTDSSSIWVDVQTLLIHPLLLSRVTFHSVVLP